jgi:hypothetical protein
MTRPEALAIVLEQYPKFTPKIVLFNTGNHLKRFRRTYFRMQTENQAYCVAVSFKNAIFSTHGICKTVNLAC